MIIYIRRIVVSTETTIIINFSNSFIFHSNLCSNHAVDWHWNVWKCLYLLIKELTNIEDKLNQILILITVGYWRWTFSMYVEYMPSVCNNAVLLTDQSTHRILILFYTYIVLAFLSAQRTKYEKRLLALFFRDVTSE